MEELNNATSRAEKLLDRLGVSEDEETIKVTLKQMIVCDLHFEVEVYDCHGWWKHNVRPTNVTTYRHIVRFIEIFGE